MSGSPNRHTVPEVARLLGISERGVRDKIARGQLRAEKEDKRWIVLLPAEAPPEATTADTVAGGSMSGSQRGSGAVVDAVVTPAAIEGAIERTGQKYVADMAALYDRISAEVGRLYAGQLAAKDETIAELRRRAEQAEAARDRLAAAQAAQDGPGAAETPTPDDPGAAPAAGLWARVRRVFGGG